MNELKKQLFTPNSTLDQLSQHKTEDQRRICRCGFESREFFFKKWLNFQKMNGCHYLLKAFVNISLFPNEGRGHIKIKAILKSRSFQKSNCKRFDFYLEAGGGPLTDAFLFRSVYSCFALSSMSWAHGPL